MRCPQSCTQMHIHRSHLYISTLFFLSSFFEGRCRCPFHIITEQQQFSRPHEPKVPTQTHTHANTVNQMTRIAFHWRNEWNCLAEISFIEFWPKTDWPLEVIFRCTWMCMTAIVSGAFLTGGQDTFSLFWYITEENKQLSLVSRMTLFLHRYY